MTSHILFCFYTARSARQKGCVNRQQLGRGGNNKGRLELTNQSEADKLKVPCDWLTRFMRVISHETMKLVKMIEMLIMRLSLNASWRISGVRKSNLQFLV